MADRLPLTPRQQQVLALIVERIAACGYPPTLREIGCQLHIASTNGVADHIKALKRKGYLKQQGQKSRTLQPLRSVAKAPQGHRSTAAKTLRTRRSKIPANYRAGTRRVPLLGRVAAGEPLLAIEQAEGEVLIDATWTTTGTTVFALSVVGDSMIDDGILDGDTIIVQQQDEARTGDIVVALIDNEATVKRYYPEGDTVRLQPANAAMKPIYLTAGQACPISIVGLVIGVYRRL